MRHNGGVSNSRIIVAPIRALARKVAMGIWFWKRTLSVVRRARRIDRKSPFLGSLSKNGFVELTLNNRDRVISDLKALYDMQSVSEQRHIHLGANLKTSLRSIFELVTPEVVAYLGSSVRLDGIAWFVSKQSDVKSISSNWHTDGVGNRIKVFVCIVGDGAMPTLLIPTNKRVPSSLDWITLSFQESLRWLRKEFKADYRNIFSCKHRSGSVYVFDTNLLHRGGYETGGTQDRVVFELEYSVPEKHDLFGSKSVIGTQEKNVFYFCRELLEIPAFSTMLDFNRIHEFEDKFMYARKDYILSR